METQKTLMRKLAGIQGTIGKLQKKQNNPFFNSKYFDINQLLETLEPYLEANNLILLQPVQDGEVKTIIIDLDTNEEYISGITLPANENNPQKIGSCITYYRRYGLQAALALQAEDDDGNKASAPAKPKATVLTDEAIERAILNGKQDIALEGIKTGKYIATTQQIEKLKN